MIVGAERYNRALATHAAKMIFEQTVNGSEEGFADFYGSVPAEAKSHVYKKMSRELLVGDPQPQSIDRAFELWAWRLDQLELANRNPVEEATGLTSLIMTPSDKREVLIKLACRTVKLAAQRIEFTEEWSLRRCQTLFSAKPIPPKHPGIGSHSLRFLTLKSAKARPFNGSSVRGVGFNCGHRPRVPVV